MERLPPYELVDLRLLIALAEHRHFARAAQACGLSQPALSARIRKLENALQTPLIYRAKRFEGFTPDGELALGWARRILADCAGLVQDVRAEEQGPHGTLRIGVVPSATPYAGRLSGQIAVKFPNLMPQLLSLSSKAIGTGLSDFSLDAGVTYLDTEGAEPSAELPANSRYLFTETYCVVARAEVVPRPTGELTWTEAANLPIGLLTRDMQNRRIIDDAFRRVGITPNLRFESNSFNAILSLVRDHGFATILPLLQVEAGLTEDLEVWDLVEPNVEARVGLVIPDRDPILPVTRALLTALDELENVRSSELIR
ncbi:DNA-binding transcriptional LysR family regulator [Roseibium hamelinense]|uniref:DNA-binding transcriptional LysR family regulator n=1 Tax=Roseibium hamelinense TaxID=150831 RepID=A0A562T1U2_9HYPH|nr:LysR substrate-binding domain-containing protein [Roseibium hamelinense]MTI43792.1 LysR family transcriptional regulator [Roseibium hamelinense]TWI87128.1 DNA-binding transcriptional LysR family regulator [Roseibium hamelinense]